MSQPALGEFLLLLIICAVWILAIYEANKPKPVSIPVYEIETTVIQQEALMQYQQRRQDLEFDYYQQIKDAEQNFYQRRQDLEMQFYKEMTITENMEPE